MLQSKCTQAQRRFFAIILTLAMVICNLTLPTVASAATASGFTSTYFKTNPTGYGKNATITIDGNFNDWNSSMLIAQGVANDDARIFRGSHEGPVYDTYALYAAWDNDNLYFMWEFTNVTDVVDPAQGYPISDNGKPWNGDIPQIIALDIDPTRSGDGMIGTNGIWGMGINYENGVDTVLCFSSKPGVGTPGLFTLNDDNEFSYETGYCTTFKNAGISFAYGDGHISDKIMGVKMNGYEGYTPDHLATDASNWVDMMEYGHDEAQDTMYEMVIPFSSLGITKDYLESYGIGAMHISTFGQSGITSIPADPSMVDNSCNPYSCDDSTSAEKEDTDIITCDLARIGRDSGDVPVRPTTSATVEPTVSASIEPSIEPTVSASVEPSIEPTATASVEPSIEPSIEPTIIPDNTVTIYYKSTANTYIHYRVDSGSWTNAPGVLMNTSDAYTGYKTATIDLGTGSTLTACFNDGNGNWDNNNSQDYLFTAGTFTIANGKIANGAPSISHNYITLYYKTTWSNAYCHYRTDSNSWTTAPGVAMTSSDFSGYKEITIDMEDATTLTACFNNGSSWDNNSGQNYYFAGVSSYVIENGVITAGTPSSQPVTENVIKIYYKTGWSTPYCHYQIGSNGWTNVSGVVMTSEGNNIYSITIDLGDATSLTACFNNGSGSWDNNNGGNYYFSQAGTYYINC